jgi:hypothetical protein
MLLVSPIVLDPSLGRDAPRRSDLPSDLLFYTRHYFTKNL